MIPALAVVAVLGLVALAGCYVVPPPSKGRYDFTPDGVVLAKAILAAAKLWQDAGVDVAHLVTVDTADGVPVKFVPRARLGELCTNPNVGDACTAYTLESTFDAIYVADDLTPERLVLVLAHEIMHVLVPTAEHLPDELGGILHRNGAGGGDGPTAHDLDEVCSHTTCETETGEEASVAH